MEAFWSFVSMFQVKLVFFKNSFIFIVLIGGMSCKVALALYYYVSSRLWKNISF